MTAENSKKIFKNEFNLMELAGAFGDLGTLVPFILIYITILKFNPAYVFLTFGIFNIFIGYLYKTPVPVQPMKAIGGFAATHAGQVTSGMVSGAGLFSGLFWSVLAVTGMTEVVAKLIKRPIAKGIILGLGLSFILEGIKMMLQIPFLSIAGLSLYFVLQRYNKVPSIFIIMLAGIIYSVVTNPDIGLKIINIRPSLILPELNLGVFNLSEFIKGVVVLAIPQIPLTLGNGIIALVEENNELFPDRAVTTRKTAMTTGLMNLVSPFLGGVPVCHGAGGMAGHVKFGARTGGATILLGLMLVILSLFFGESLELILSMFPKSILGIIMLLAGTELAFSSYVSEMSKADFSILTLIAGLTMWNVGAALIVGVVFTYLNKNKSSESSD